MTATTLSGGKKALIAFGVACACALFCGAMHLVAWVIDARSVDATGRLVNAKLTTSDVAPGDDLALKLMTGGDLRRLRARIGSRPAVDVWTWTGPASDGRFAITIPRDVELGSVRIGLDVDLDYRVETSRALNTVYYRTVQRRDTIEVSVPIVSPEHQASRRWVLRGVAAASWIVGLVVTYALVRWSFRRLFARVKRKPGSMLERIVFAALLVAMFAAAAIGQLIFVTPIVRTTTFSTLPPIVAIQLGWTVSIALGLWRGLLARAAAPAVTVHEWRSGKVRAVIGSGRETGYREAASTLPPMLSREAPGLEAVAIIELFRELGCEVVRRRNALEVTLDGEPVLRLTALRAEPWLPEDLALSIREDVDGEPLVRELTKLFGPLEYQRHGGKPSIVE
ncbi:MAG: hypothetical protein H0T46_19530 [Deltaproteobacteria bacterium]|nr:hypothetical protein [Deltaproteobacteria bacterium]